MKKIFALFSIVLVAIMTFACSKTVTHNKNNQTPSSTTTVQSSQSSDTNTSGTSASTKPTSTTVTTSATVTAKPTTATTATTKPTTVTTVTTKPTTVTTATTKPTTVTTVTTATTVTTVVTTAPTVYPPVADAEIEMEYDDKGNVSSIQYFDKDGVLLKKEFLSYNAEGEVAGRQSVDYEYNDLGKVATEVHSTVAADGKTSSFSLFTYRYDKKANLTEKKYFGLNDKNVLVLLHSNSYVYSDEGELTEKKYFEYDEKGNVIYEETETYSAGELLHTVYKTNTYANSDTLLFEDSIKKDASGKTVETIGVVHEYNAKKLLCKTTATVYDAEGKAIKVTVYEYDFYESGAVRSCTVYVNGEKVSYEEY